MSDMCCKLKRELTTDAVNVTVVTQSLQQPQAETKPVAPAAVIGSAAGPQQTQVEAQIPEAQRQPPVNPPVAPITEKVQAPAPPAPSMSS
ncbi:unnamed protein product [Rodentolepis nana]|uniref:Uncharacterized protein n=1 Tax=Rodentolepis nana TaxID=102285 RepID=A0A0R3TIE0_RODNA|nr:unnamed protein product [Rodentolepis nana]